jgi:hypothetical protein
LIFNVNLNILICPIEDLKVLLNQRATQMTFKDQAKTIATVQFHKTAPSTSWNQSDFKPSSMDGSPPTSHTPQDVIGFAFVNV